MPDGGNLVLQLPRPGEPESAMLAGMAAPAPRQDALRKPLAPSYGFPWLDEGGTDAPGQGLPSAPGQELPEDAAGGVIVDTSIGPASLQQPAHWSYDFDPATGNAVASYPGEVNIDGVQIGGPVTGTGATVLQTGPTIVNPFLSGRATFALGTPAQPSIVPTGFTNTGIYWGAAGQTAISVLGNFVAWFNGAGLQMQANYTLTMLGGAIILSAGSVANPSLQLAASPNTGFYSAGGAAMGVAVGGNPVAWFAGNGIQLQGPYNVSFSGTGGVIGSTNGGNALAGNVGEFMNLSTATIGIANGVFTSLGTLTLTPGDWDLYGTMELTPGSGVTFTSVQAGPAGSNTTFGPYQFTVLPYTSNPSVPCFAGFPTQRIVNTTAVTIYLGVIATFTGGACNAAGVLSARRMR
jgi:hypothetical protein